MNILNRFSENPAIVALFLTYLMVASCAQASSSADLKVVSFRGDSAHTGVYQTAPVESYGGLQWHFQTNAPVRSTPAIVRGVLYIGSDDGFLYALDAVTGDLRWKLNAGSAVSSSPAVAGETVFIGTRDNQLLAVNAESGKLLWKKETGADLPWAWGFETGDSYTSSPAIINNTVLFGSGDGFLYSFEAKNGRLQWKFQTGGRIRSTAAVGADGVTVYIGSFDGSLYSLSLADGKQKWRFDTDGRNLHSGDFGFDRKSIQSSPAVDGDTVYFGARDGFLYAVSSSEGKLRWRFDHEQSWVNTSPAIADNTVYAASSDGHFLQAVDTRTGKENWRSETTRPIWSSPLVVGKYLYFCDWAGNINAIDRTEGGKLIWRFKAESKILSSPIIEDGKLFFGSDDGNVYAINSMATTDSLKRAVFWDADYIKGATYRGHEAVRDYLKDNDYQILNAADIAKFLEARINDRVQSVVVFAIDHLPKTIGLQSDDSSLLKRYLDRGGKIIWLSSLPLIWEKDLQTGERFYDTVNRAAPEKLIGVNNQKGNFEQLTSRATSEGERWNLDGWWQSNFGVEPNQVSTVLALDEKGLATAWVKNYGGGKGTGFVRFPVVESVNGSPANLRAIKLAAEYFPK